jgi:hypothetical protein
MHLTTFWVQQAVGNSVAFSPLVNYTNWVTATGRWILVPTFSVDRGSSCGQHSGTPKAVNLSFIDRSRYIFFQVAPHLSSRGWVDPVPDPLLLRKSGSAGDRTRDLCDCSQKLWPLDHRGGRGRHLMVSLLSSHFYAWVIGTWFVG